MFLPTEKTNEKCALIFYKTTNAWFFLSLKYRNPKVVLFQPNTVPKVMSWPRLKAIWDIFSLSLRGQCKYLAELFSFSHWRTVKNRYISQLYRTAH
jgi:hypothetical protein